MRYEGQATCIVLGAPTKQRQIMANFVTRVNRVDPTKYTSAINPDRSMSVLAGSNDCALNGEMYPEGTIVCFEDMQLMCDGGAWREVGKC